MGFTSRDYGNEAIYLSEQVYHVILEKHPEANQFFDRISETVSAPDQVRRSVSDASARLYYHFYPDVLDGKFVAVVVKRVDRNFIPTFYATDRIKEGEILWQK